MPAYDDDLRLAHVLADAAERVTMERFKAVDLHVETKPDLTPVSDADRAVEELLRGSLARTRPRDGIIGEEFGETGHSPRRWVIDPIDGTKNFVRGVPVWATLVALIDGDQVVLGLVAAPALGRRWWAGIGTGAWTGRSLLKASRMRVSGLRSLSDASVAHATLSAWRAVDRYDAFTKLTEDCWRERGFGDFWSYMLVAEGACDIAAEPELALYDMAALVPIVTEAGGTFTSIDGTPGPWGPGAIATNGLLHREVLARLAAPAR